jgi:uncharacterized protein YdaU (DUF1376 family)
MPITQSFPFFPSDYLGDPHTIVMTTEENGAYCLLMWVCWEQDGLPNDLEELAGYARLPLEKFQPMWEKKIKRCFTLNEKTNVFLHPRFEKIIRKAKAYKKQQSNAGKASGQKRRKTKELDAEQPLTSVEQVPNRNEVSYTSSSSFKREEKEEEEKPSEKPHKLPKDFQLTDEMVKYAEDHGLKRKVTDIFEEFTDFWQNIATKNNKRTSRGWTSTWQKRIRDLAEKNGNHSLNGAKAPDMLDPYGRPIGTFGR